MPSKENQEVSVEELFAYIRSYLDEKQVALVEKHINWLR